VEQAVLDRGRPGHWGVKGMRERAERIGATIRLQSHVNAGANVELVVPGWFAFVPAAVAGPQDAPGMPPRWLGSRLRP
jgi:hypothetical protein